MISLFCGTCISNTHMQRLRAKPKEHLCRRTCATETKAPTLPRTCWQEHTPAAGHVRQFKTGISGWGGSLCQLMNIHSLSAFIKENTDECSLAANQIGKAKTSHKRMWQRQFTVNKQDKWGASSDKTPGLDLAEILFDQKRICF